MRWVKSIVAYLFYLAHFIAVIHLGLNAPIKLFEWKYQKPFSIGLIAIGGILYSMAYLKLGVQKSSGGQLLKSYHNRNLQRFQKSPGTGMGDNFDGNELILQFAVLAYFNARPVASF